MGNLEISNLQIISPKNEEVYSLNKEQHSIELILALKYDRFDKWPVVIAPSYHDHGSRIPRATLMILFLFNLLCLFLIH